MKKWITVLILMIGFNALLLNSYLDKKNYLQSAFTQIQSEPSVENYSMLSEGIIDNINYVIPNEDKDLKDRFIRSSKKIDHCIQVLKSEINKDFEEQNRARFDDFFRNHKSLPEDFQDSLWDAWITYREAIDQTMEINHFMRNKWQARYRKAAGIYTTAQQLTIKNEMSELQKSLDSLSGRFNWAHGLQVTDSIKLKNFVDFLYNESNPGDAVRMNSLLIKADAFFVSPGKVSLYGRTYLFKNLTPLETRKLYREMIFLKGSIDRQLAELLNTLPI